MATLLTAQQSTEVYVASPVRYAILGVSKVSGPPCLFSGPCVPACIHSALENVENILCGPHCEKFGDPLLYAMPKWQQFGINTNWSPVP